MLPILSARETLLWVPMHSRFRRYLAEFVYVLIQKPENLFDKDRRCLGLEEYVLEQEMHFLISN